MNIKISAVAFLLMTALSLTVFCQNGNEVVSIPLKDATVKFFLSDLPGKNLEKSKWDVTFELRVLSRKEMYDASKLGLLKRMQDEQRLGVLVGKGSVSKSLLSSVKNREAVFVSEMSLELQERLKKEPTEEVILSEAVISEETISRSRLNETKSQIFLLYASALVYDAKLKKNIIVPLNRVLPFARHRNAKFEMNIVISETGTYNASVVNSEASMEKSVQTLILK